MFSQMFLNILYRSADGVFRMLPTPNLADRANVGDLHILSTLTDLLYGINYFIPLYHVGLILGLGLALEGFYMLVKIKKAVLV